MDPELAQKRFANGGIIVCLDVPEGSEVGIDCFSWNVGPRFKGIKMIPPGIHFLYYSAVDKSGNTAPRTGMFLAVNKGDIIVKKWDALTEDMVDAHVSEDDLDKYRHGLKELDSHLGPYPFENLKKWTSLTSHITKQVLDRLQPNCGKISSVTQVPSHDDYKTENNKMEIDEINLNALFEQSDEGKITFTKIPKHKYPNSASPAEITKYSIDSSYSLECMIKQLEDKSEILGELQFAFVCFLLGQVFDAFEHWKQLLHILCTSDEALTKYTAVFTELIGILHFQLQEAPKDFFVDIVTRNNFLTATLQEFFSNLEASPAVDQKLVKKGQRFRQHLTKAFQWDFESEPDENEPIVVET